MEMPRNIGPFHIIGIGGIGMSAIAEILLELGYQVQGSDAKENANVRRLRNRGLRVFIGQDAQNLIGARYVVVSTAIKRDNPELLGARRRGLPVIRRADMLAELMRMRKTVSVTGTHGKTTTTSLIAHIFEQGGLDPTVITGGIVNSWGSNARLGQGEWMVVEADESDGTFIKLPTEIGVVTNIDPEHLDYFGTVERMHRQFRRFYTAIPFYGAAVTCTDHPVVRSMVKEVMEEVSAPILTYGTTEDVDLRISAVRAEAGGMTFDLDVGARVRGGARHIAGLHMPVPGHHNALNATAAFAVAAHAGLADEVIVPRLATFSGVKRRFTPTGSWNGVSFFDDYAHHPVELTAVLKAARAATSGRVIGIFQPHRYSRLSNLFDDFCNAFADADMVVVTPVYTAGESPILGIDHHSIAAGIRRTGHAGVEVVESETELAPLIASLARPGDLVIGLGAGTITEWSYALPQWLTGGARTAGGAA
ncbi:MAG: UDP-N-acetylmuramate--L-alanine ligase [Hyphomicrobiaceae bacterium]